MTKKQKNIWLNYMKALTIVRNKSSHSDPSLSENDRSTMALGGFQAMIANDGTLQTNPRHYAQAATFALNFFDELQSSINSQEST